MYKRIAGIFYIFTISCLLFSYSGKPEIFPEWMEDLRLVYPLEDYFAQIGEGKTEVMAKNSAVAKIASYLESNVESTTESSYTVSQNGDAVNKVQNVNVSTTVSSDITLFAVEYTDAFYSRNEKKYYVAAYISRETLWTQYVPIIEDSKDVFYGYVKNAENEKDPFVKISYYQQALESSKDFLFKLDYGRVISPKREQAFSGDRNFIASIPAKISEIKSNISFYINVKDDYLNSVSADIKKQVLDLGYKTKTTKDASYTIDAVVNYNESLDDDLIILNPVLSIHIFNEVRDFMNMEIVSDEVVAATKDYAKQFAVKDLSEKISLDFKNRLEKIYEIQ